MYKLQEMFKASTGPADYARRYCKHMADVLAALDVEKLVRGEGLGVGGHGEQGGEAKPK